jgi:outer membrane immunogenic protein
VKESDVQAVRSILAATAMFVGAGALPAQAQDSAAHDWTGFYAGVFGGYNTVQFTDDENGVFANSTGLMAGVAASYQQQFDTVVFGVDADISLSGTNDDYDAGVVRGGGNISADVLGSLRARVGMAVGSLQIYGTGGLGYGHVSDQFLDSSDANWMAGWTAGIGAAVVLTDTISLDMHYLHAQLGPVAFFGGSLEESIKTNTITAGVNFHF